MSDVRPPAPAVLPILRSRLVGELLATLAADPERWVSIGDLAERLEAPYPTVTREVRRIEEANLVETEQIGRTKRLRLDCSHPLHVPLVELMLGAFGPRIVVAEEFASVGGIDQVAIFGSWAARHHGQRGSAPRDIDVLVLGHPDRDHLHAATRRAERRLGLPVNATLRRTAEWEAADDSFAQSVKGGPLVIVLPNQRDGR